MCPIAWPCYLSSTIHQCIATAICLLFFILFKLLISPIISPAFVAVTSTNYLILFVLYLHVAQNITNGLTFFIISHILPKNKTSGLVLRILYNFYMSSLLIVFILLCHEKYLNCVCVEIINIYLFIYCTVYSVHPAWGYLFIIETKFSSSWMRSCINKWDKLPHEWGHVLYQ